jgi:hypothetical protein
MSINNLNNKFGKCCNCPALMSDSGRMFTNYVSSRIYNHERKDKIFNLDSKLFKQILDEKKQQLAKEDPSAYKKLLKNEQYLIETNNEFRQILKEEESEMLLSDINEFYKILKLDKSELFNIDSNTYRELLQKDTSRLINIDRQQLKSMECKSNATNTFYIDSSKYNFESDLTDGYFGGKDIYLGDRISNGFNTKNTRNRVDNF